MKIQIRTVNQQPVGSKVGSVLKGQIYEVEPVIREVHHQLEKILKRSTAKVSEIKAI